MTTQHRRPTAAPTERPVLDIADVVRPPHWMTRAACTDPDVDADLFFAEDSGARRAKKICRSCPVIAECLSYVLAIEHGESAHRTTYVAGVWGGTTANERRETRNRRRRGAA